MTEARVKSQITRLQLHHKTYIAPLVQRGITDLTRNHGLTHNQTRTSNVAQLIALHLLTFIIATMTQLSKLISTASLLDNYDLISAESDIVCRWSDGLQICSDRVSYRSDCKCYCCLVETIDRQANYSSCRV